MNIRVAIVGDLVTEVIQFMDTVMRRVNRGNRTARRWEGATRLGGVEMVIEVPAELDFCQ